MSNEEDDYLSDKFLASLEAPKPNTSNISYAERRRVAQRESERKRLEGRIKSRREMEEEARREGLSRSLFEKEADAEGGESSNKAMAMMLKMGFKPGESLGKKEEPVKPPSDDTTEAKIEEQPEKVKSGHLTEPLPLAVWAGRKGLGLGKRAMSPPLSGSSKAAKASAEEDAAEKSRNENFRAQARGEYEDRRDEGRLRAALRTCENLDEAHGVKFNVLKLNPSDPSSIPELLYDLLTRAPSGAIEDSAIEAKPGYRVSAESEFDEGVGPGSDRAIAARLKEQMKADSLRPLKESSEDFLALRDAVKTEVPKQEIVDDQIDFDQETIDAAKEYLQKNAGARTISDGAGLFKDEILLLLLADTTPLRSTEPNTHSLLHWLHYWSEPASLTVESYTIVVYYPSSVVSLPEDQLRGLVEAYEAKLSEVGPTAVGSNLALWSAVSVIYEPKVKYHEGEKTPPKISSGFFSWVSPLIHVKEPELLEKIGLDAVTFLRFLRLLRWSFTGVAFISVAGIGIFDYVYNLKNVKASDRNILSMFTIENIHEQALYVHVAGAYAITFIILGSIWWHWREMVKLRLQWFRSDEYLKSFYARTLMITQVPKKLQSDTGIEGLFDDMRMPYPTTAVHIGRRVGHLPEMIEYHNQAVRDLEEVLVKYLKGGKLGKKRPTITIGGFLGFGGTKKDAIDFYSQRIANMEKAVEEARSQIDTKKPENYGFASMAAVPYAHTVAQMLHRKHPKGTTITLAPNPKDIIWSNLTKSEAALASSRTTGWLLIAGVCFFNTIPLLIISALTNLAAISEYVGFLGRWADNSPTTFSLVSGILPPSISALFGFFFPIIMRKISEYQGAITHSRLDRAVVARYFAFLIISQFFIFSLLGVGFQTVTEVQFIIGKGQGIKSILKSLNKIPGRIQSTYIQQSSYWLTFFPMRGFLAVFDLAQLLSVVLVFIKTHLFGRTPRDIREWTKPPEFDFAVYYSNILFMAAVGLMYAPLAPLVALAAAVVFWLSSFVYKYQLMFVFVSKVESGGRLWNVVMNRMLVSVIFMNLIVTLTIGLQRGWTSYVWTSTVPPTILTILFKIWMRMTLDKQFRHFVPEEDEIARARVHKQDAKTGRLESRFGHPSLHMELFTPMVHSNMTHLLEQVYQGRLAKEQTRMEEYGGKKVAVSVLPSGLKFASVAEHELEMDTTLYQRDRGELDWDARSIASTAMLDDTPVKTKPAGYERYMKHGVHHSNGSDIELTRLDSRDNVPLLNRPAMTRDMSLPSRPGSRLAREADIGVPAPPPGIYRQDSAPSMYRNDSAYSQAPMMHRQESHQMYHQTSHAGSDWSLPPSYRAPSRTGGEPNGNMAGRGAFRG